MKFGLSMKPFVLSLSKHEWLLGLRQTCRERRSFLRQADVTTDKTTSHLTRLSKNDSRVIGYSHSTKLSKYDSQVAGYQDERGLDGI